MKTVIIRDDDVSYFTSPAQLETIYGRLWHANIPVCFAVIPEQRADVRVLHRESQPFDPSVPKQYRGQAKSFPLADNSELCEFLNDKAKNGLVEVCLHGFHHTYYEFDSHDETLLNQKIEHGLTQLRTAMPDAKIRTFIAPYDVISPTAFNLLLKHNFNICTCTASLKATPYATLQSYQRTALSPTQYLYACDEYFFSRHSTPEDGLTLAQSRLQNDLIIAINHYWTFFYDWQGEWAAMLDAWHQYVDNLLALQDVTFGTFGED
jgi:hypothetical protein